MSLAIVEETLKTRHEAHTRLLVENETLDRQIDQNANKVAQCATQLDLGQRALQFLEDVANSRRSGMKAQVESVVTEALSLIYGDDYSIELVYNVKNNRSFMEVELVKKTNAGEVRRQMNGFGGGVSDTISVPLRLLVLLASRQVDRICILDECYKHVDPNRIERVAEFIKEISVKLDLQIIMCSHHEAMQYTADSVWMIQDDRGKSVVTQVKEAQVVGEE